MNDRLSINSLAAETQRRFRAQFGAEAAWIAAAPGRVNLIGGHVDYNDGLVLPMAIDRYTMVAAALAPHQGTERRLTVYSVQQDESFSLKLNEGCSPGRGGWSDYIRGVAILIEELGWKIPSLNLLIHSDVPLGSGLSSSAALEVATATLLEAVLGKVLGKEEKAKLCQRAEHRFVGVPCGIMDQFTSVFGLENSLLYLDCRDCSYRQVEFSSDELVVLLINSQVKHNLASSEYSVRQQQCSSAAKKLLVQSLREVSESELDSKRTCLDPIEYQRAKHVVSENIRTAEFVKAIERCDWIAAGELLYASHESLRVDYDVSCSELDLLVQLAGEIGVGGGVFGSRMTGGGFGGCTVTLVSRQSAAQVSALILDHYKQASGIEATAFFTRPSHGAQVVLSDGRH